MGVAVEVPVLEGVTVGVTVIAAEPLGVEVAAEVLLGVPVTAAVSEAVKLGVLETEDVDDAVLEVVEVRELVAGGDEVELAVGVCVRDNDGVIVELCEGGNIVNRGTGAASMRVPGGADSEPSAPQTSQEEPTPGRADRTRLLRA